MEKYNLNEGNDALKRVLLMMKYDAKKTLTENIEEMDSVDEQYGGAAAAGVGVGAAVGAGTALASAVPAGAGALIAAPTGVATLIPTIASWTLGTGSFIGTTAATALVGGAIGLAVVPLIYWLATKDTGANKVKKMFDMCSTDAAKIAKLKRKLSDGVLRSITDDIEDAIINDSFGFQGGTDEEKLFGAFKKLEAGTASDFCALIKYYNTHSDSGDLFDDLDSDIDAESEWKQIYRPIRNCVEDSLKEIVEDTIKDCKQNPKQAKCKKVVPVPVPVKPKFKDCTGTYTIGCKSDVIKKVQGCLNIKADGLFGQKTQGALESKGFKNGFTDADVAKLCPANVVVQPTPPKPEDEYGYDPNRNQNVPFDSTVSHISVDKLDTI